MSGFYRRAIDFLSQDPHPHLKLVKKGTDSYEDFDGTPEEREQIEAEIRLAMQSQKITRDDAQQQTPPRQAGYGLPLLVNVGAVILIVVGAFVLFRHFDSQEQLAVERTVSLFSAEGRLLSALREESEAQLEEKEREISAFQERLTNLEAERRLVESQISSQLAQQEEELRIAFERELEAERSRLAALDIDADEIERRLAEFSESRNEELSRELARVQAEAQAEIESRAAAFAASLAEVEGALRSAETEREALAQAVQEQQEQAAAEFATREAELRAERTEAMNRLSDLQARQEQTQLVLDQLVSFYAGVRESLSADRLDAAAEQLESLRAYLEAGPIASIPELQRRRGVELFLVGTLESQLERRLTAGGVASIDEQLALASDELQALRSELSTIEDELEQQIAAVAQRDARISELEASSARPVDTAELDRLETELAAVRANLDQQAAATDRAIAERNAALTRTAQAEAAAADLEAQLARTTSELDTTRAELAAAAREIGAASREIESLQARAGEYQTILAGISDVRKQINDSITPATPPDFELLETKLLVLRIVGSPAVRAEHPALHARFNEYLDALIAEQRFTAVRETLQDVAALMAELPGTADRP